MEKRLSFTPGLAGSEDSFFKHGLIGVRQVDGSTHCNISVAKDDGTRTYAVDWSVRGSLRLRLALEVVLKMLEYPTRETSPFGHIATRNYLRASPHGDTLPDGQYFSSSAAGIALYFDREYLGRTAPDNLSLSQEVIKETLLRYMHWLYPDSATALDRRV